MASTTASTAVFVICWVIIHLIILPYDGYWLYKFWKHRYALIIQKRKPRLFVLKTVALWTFILLFFTLYAIIVEDNRVSEGVKLVLICIICIGLSPLIWCNSLLHAGRYWLIFYMINYNADIIHNKWQTVIDPTAAKNSWYLENKEIWGTWKFVRKVLIIYGCTAWFICIFPFILYFAGSSNEMIQIFSLIGWLVFFVFAVFLPISLYIYMLCTTPKISDDIGIRAELKFSICTILSIMVLIGVLVIISFNWPDSWNWNDFCILFYIWFTMIRCLFLAGSLKHTKWPLSTFEEIVVGRHSDVRMQELAHQKTYHAIAQKSMEMEILNWENEDIALKKQMTDTLQNGDLFDLFMLQLLNEYCAECLLSIIEFIQFKKKIIADNKDIKFDEKDLESALILPSTCPQSYIIYGDQDPNYKNNYKYIAKKLYKRYICIGAKWEINIDYNNRTRYMDLFENNNLSEDKQELYTLFNPCIDHMMSLLSSAFVRFQNSKQYQMIQQYSPPISPKYKLSNAKKLIQQISNSHKDDNSTDSVDDKVTKDQDVE